MRDLLIIISMCVAAVAVGTWLYFYVPSTDLRPTETSEIEEVQAQEASSEAVPVSFMELAQGSSATEYTARKNYAIYSVDEFARVWKKAGRTDDVPSVDFSTQYVIAVFAGTKGTGGHTIEVSAVTDTAGARSVALRLSEPGASCVVTQAQTSPYQIIVVPHGELSLSHTDTTAVSECSE
tara:strand:+ start:565919 stop:566458 length:540 start_codon:yes stop_codon:yes gene_type:complete